MAQAAPQAIIDRATSESAAIRDTAPADAAQQLALIEPPRRAGSRHYARHDRIGEGRVQPARPLCAGCREKEARYGFRSEDDPVAARPRTLCFECFRVEIGRRQSVAAQLARGWNARQVGLPLEEKLDTLSLRRRRAQIAARHALGL
jgi:hypothetical protein